MFTCLGNFSAEQLRKSNVTFTEFSRKFGSKRTRTFQVTFSVLTISIQSILVNVQSIINKEIQPGLTFSGFCQHFIKMVRAQNTKLSIYNYLHACARGSLTEQAN
jgi:hypothetical protein